MNTLLLGIPVLLALTVGCTQTVRFRVVDASTDQPMAGVRVGVTSKYGDFIFAPNPVFRFSVLPDTGSDGVVTAKDLKKSWSHDIFLNKEGYAKARVIVGGIVHDQAGIISPDVLENPGETADGKTLFTVKMYPTTHPTTAPARQ